MTADLPMAVVRGTIIGLGGVVVAVAATLVSRLEWRPDSLVLPWGLVVAVTGSAAAVALARVSGRAYGFVAAGGWLVGAALALFGRPEGDYVIASDLLGYGFLLGGTMVVIATAAVGRSPR